MPPDPLEFCAFGTGQFLQSEPYTSTLSHLAQTFLTTLGPTGWWRVLPYMCLPTTEKKAGTCWKISNQLLLCGRGLWVSLRPFVHRLPKHPSLGSIATNVQLNKIMHSIVSQRLPSTNACQT